MKEKIVEILNNKPLTFAALQKALGDEGKEVLTVGSNNNLILWAGCSEEFFTAISVLLQEGKITFFKTSPEAYHKDGKQLIIPVARNFEKEYKKPRWAPVLVAIRNLEEEK